MKTFEIHYEFIIEGSVEVEEESIEKAIEKFDLSDADYTDPCEAVVKDQKIVAVLWKEVSKQEVK